MKRQQTKFSRSNHEGIWKKRVKIYH